MLIGAAHWRRNVIDCIVADRQQIKKIGITKNAKLVYTRRNMHSETRLNIIHGRNTADDERRNKPFGKTLKQQTPHS